jgi:hypothetical protein
MQADWYTRLAQTMPRTTAQQEQVFVNVVDECVGHCDLDAARALMKTFSAKPDYGTQQAVVSALSTASAHDRITAVLEDLPRLLDEAYEWAEDLVGGEVDQNPEIVASVAAHLDEDRKKRLRELLADPSFAAFFPNARALSI